MNINSIVIWAMLACAFGVVVGCEPESSDFDGIVLGAIEPSEEGGEALDTEWIGSDEEEIPSEAGTSPRKPKSEEESNGEPEDFEAPETVLEPNRSDEKEEDATDSSEEAEPVDSDGVEEVSSTEGSLDEPEEAEVKPDSSGPAEPEEGSGESKDNAAGDSVPTPLNDGTLHFALNVGCSGAGASEMGDGTAYVIGMDKWQEEWAVAAALTDPDSTGVYQGSWIGTPGEYTFLFSFGAMEGGSWNPWSLVEDLLGQSCVSDAYGNRSVTVVAGEEASLLFAYNQCDECPASCQGSCGAISAQGECYCDTGCQGFGDCCDDYESVCVAGNTCEGKCGEQSDDESCYCDSLCTSYNDCCDDFLGFCPEED